MWPKEATVRMVYWLKTAKNERDAYMLRGNLLLDTGVI
jgi:hypothetical protein